MNVLGQGPHLWRVEVVLWMPTPESRRIRELLDAVAGLTRPSDESGDSWLGDVTTASSYDIQPPEPDRGIGVACWVRAETVGTAADTAWRAVASAAEAALGVQPPLWDLRVIPRGAILSASDTGTPLTS